MAPFELIPAIDLLGGRCVRLAQGDYGRATVYGDDPGAVAAGFCAAGARRVHVVDLDGARSGEQHNGAALAAILRAARAAGVPVQLGGGLRSLAAVEAALAAGVERAILGTAALRDPALVREAAARFPGRVAVGLDARAGRVAVAGWLETSETTALEVGRLFEDAGVAALVYTDIARDGMGSGPDLDGAAALAAAVAIPVIASGGVGSLAHVRAAAARARDGVAGVIVGRALYTGAVDLAAALALTGVHPPDPHPCS
ncbi:MAG: 1-(5-phosphoribosyl)-5-[(5-phosphoribosylamino)methylideneamino]imidazole-4-carboxamide isomerase [Deltaproteobacteria bacterium]|nr:1-(5-phosphoribosyl)-5-[(5-phosphoribosylamino)methylideneamino]imidazole-4-carboxamide isomerase [Deltaproteobacteria bacterium]